VLRPPSHFRITVSTGSPSDSSQAQGQKGQTDRFAIATKDMWAGVFILVGIGLMVARYWVPTISLTAVALAIGAGIAILVLPVLNQWVVGILGGAVVLAALVGTWHNRQVKADPTLLAKTTTPGPGITPTSS
jgi:hypothetical protein